MAMTESCTHLLPEAIAGGTLLFPMINAAMSPGSADIAQRNKTQRSRGGTLARSLIRYRPAETHLLNH
jgi:hypothetical protein